MANKKVLYTIITILVLVIIGGGLFFFLGNKKGQEGDKTSQPISSSTAQTSLTDEKMVDCGTATDPGCFISRMNGCLPVTTKMIGSDNNTAIEITILGVENETCHFQRKINNVADLNCYFPKGTLNMDTFNQMFGNDKGLQQVVDDACKYPTGSTGW